MKHSAKDKCFADMQSRILSTELEPGTALDETALAAQYGISRTPMREVLQRLEGAGYVCSEGGRSATVASMDLATLRVFFQTAPMVYANIASLAAENRTNAQLESLKDAQMTFKKATAQGDPATAALANHTIHNVIGQMAKNDYLMASLGRLLIDHTRLSQTFYRPASAQESVLITKAVEQHDAMIAALQSRESALMVDLTLQHWDLSRDRLERFVRPDPLPIDVIAMKGRAHAV